MFPPASQTQHIQNFSSSFFSICLLFLEFSLLQAPPLSHNPLLPKANILLETLTFLCYFLVSYHHPGYQSPLSKSCSTGWLRLHSPASLWFHLHVLSLHSPYKKPWCLIRHCVQSLFPICLASGLSMIMPHPLCSLSTYPPTPHYTQKVPFF